MKCRRFIYNPKTSQDYHRELRRSLTPAEACSGETLKNSGPYVADFYCPERRLVAELDGAAHEGPLEIERDETRTTYRVMRFDNRAAFESLELVLNSIRLDLQETLESLDHTTPAFGHPSSC